LATATSRRRASSEAESPTSIRRARNTLSAIPAASVAAAPPTKAETSRNSPTSWSREGIRDTRRLYDIVRCGILVPNTKIELTILAIVNERSGQVTIRFKFFYRSQALELASNQSV